MFSSLHVARGFASVRARPVPGCIDLIGRLGLCSLSLHFIRRPETGFFQFIVMHILVS